MRHVREQCLFYSQLQRNSKVPSRQLRDGAATPTPSLRLVLSRTGATKLWAGTVTIELAAKTGAHHHGDLESVIYVVRCARIPPASSGAQCSRHRHSRRPQRRQQSAGQAHCERPDDADLSKLRRDLELKAEAEGADRHAVEEDPGECGSEQRAR